MGLADVLFGRPLASDEDAQQKIGPAAGVPIFGLDALGSAAYGPEAALTVLLPLGAAASAYSLPLTAAVVVLLAIVYLSYRQTIEAYPTGGGSYTVARQNLGARVGLLAGTALMMDYILNVAVGISTGVGALVSALPTLHPHTLSLCLCLLYTSDAADDWLVGVGWGGGGGGFWGGGGGGGGAGGGGRPIDAWCVARSPGCC